MTGDGVFIAEAVRNLHSVNAGDIKQHEVKRSRWIITAVADIVTELIRRTQMEKGGVVKERAVPSL